MLTRTIAVIFCLLPAMTLTVSAQQEVVRPIPQPQKVSSQPNIVMIAIDDLNDWVEPLAGHPQVQTPAIAQLAQRGVTFTNAHCQAPLCNPSRTSIMTGLRPESTGVYGLAPWFRTLPEFEDRVTLQQYFQRHGYRTLIGGKIFHGPYGRGKNSSDECDTWGPNASVGVTPKQKLIPPTPGGNHALMDWGTFPHRDEDKGDWKVASWAVKELEKMPADKPFFLSVGFFLPHVPCYATQKWFDLYPEHDLQLRPSSPETATIRPWRPGTFTGIFPNLGQNGSLKTISSNRWCAPISHRSVLSIVRWVECSTLSKRRRMPTTPSWSYGATMGITWARRRSRERIRSGPAQPVCP